jgi:hypothetical protein
MLRLGTNGTITTPATGEAGGEEEEEAAAADDGE